jgi:dipeptidyl aminopeptidase/acylaminoacyl peptidase
VISTGALAVGSALFVALRSYRQQTAVFFPERRPVAVPASQAGLPALTEVPIAGGGTVIQGWYVPSKNRAAVLLLHGAGGDRSSLLPEARLLVARGFGVLTIDLPGHGESGGSINWARGERESVAAAVEWLSRKDDIDASRLGAYGFSLGGYILAQVAAREPRLRACVFAGTPSDPREQVRFQHRRHWLFAQLPALWVLRRGGMDLDVRARDFIGKIAPRSVLVIQGTDDQTVSAAMGEELFARAGEPKELLLIPGGGHGGFDTTAEYGSRLATFFERALLGPGPSGAAPAPLP